MPNAKTAALPVFRTRGTVDNSTYNEKERTVEVVFSTDAKVWMGGFYETLSHKPEHVRMARFNTGSANAIDNHDRHGSVTVTVLGVIKEATIEPAEGHGRAKIKFSSRASLAEFRKDVEEGITTNVSTGYRVYKYEEILQGDESAVPHYRAIDWEPMEISFTPVPGDYNANTRNAADYLNQIEIIKSNTRTAMTKEELEAEKQRKAAEDQKAKDEAEKQRKASEEKPKPAPKPAPVPVEGAEGKRSAEDVQTLIANEIREERKRAAAITESVRIAGLDDKFALELIQSEKSIDQARQAVLDKFFEGDFKARSGNTKVTGPDEIEKENNLIEGALLHRAAPDLFKLEDGSAPFMSMSLVDLGRRAVEKTGVDTKSMLNNEIAGRALSTSDYPILLSNVTNKILRKSYAEVAPNWKPLASQMSANDFKEISGIQFGGSIELEKVNELGEYKYAKMKEDQEKFKIESYGKIISISRQAIINDDLNGFSRAANLFGRAAANLESRIIWNMLINNIKMADGKEIFHADHKNIITGAGSALSEAGLSAARVQMMRQTGLEKEQLDLQPVFLIVPPELLTTAQKLVTTISASETEKVNVFSGAFQIIVSTRLTSATQWYLACSPSQIDMLVYAYLNGNAGLYTETKSGFEVDAVQIKARQDFGAGIFDYRGFLRAAGA